MSNPEVHINDGSAHDRAMAWSQGHTEGYDEALAEVHRVWLEEGERVAFALVCGASGRRPDVDASLALALRDWLEATGDDRQSEDDLRDAAETWLESSPMTPPTP